MDVSINTFLNYIKVEKGLSGNTVLAYRRDLKKLAAYAAKRKLDLRSIQPDDLVGFLAELYQQKLDSRSVARHLVTVRNFFRFAMREGMVEADPTLTLESPRTRRSLPSYLRFRIAANYLEARALLRLGQHDRRAEDDLLALVRMGTLLGRGPWLIQPLMQARGIPPAWFGPLWAAAHVWLAAASLASARVVGALGIRASLLACCLLVPAEHNDRPRSHVLFLAHNCGNTFVKEITKDLLRVLQVFLSLGGLRRRHRRR